MNIVGSRGLDFDDVLLVPQRSSGQSRGLVNLRTVISRNNRTGKELAIEHPIVSANMDTITCVDMAIAIGTTGGCGFLHRYRSSDFRIDDIKRMKRLGYWLAVASVGIDTNCINDARAYLAVGADAVCVDVAHAHTDRVVAFVQELTKDRPDAHIIVGNVGTAEAAEDLYDAGATGIKVGIGPGMVCRTRQETGCGVPQLTAIENVANARHDIPIIADGGIRCSGDIVKALAAGADAVMVGYLLAGTNEAAGHDPAGSTYRGMASAEAQNNWKGFSKNVEGISITVKGKGSVKWVVDHLLDGVRSGFRYCGADNIKELQGKAKFGLARHR